ncbi:OmpH family outer membrane protein, partial [Octadecabacter sp.]|nr:OmpH family outer membrane protein [Octadecabacter sp.]
MIRIWACLLLIVVAGSAGAQQQAGEAGPSPQDGPVATSVLTMDVDRLFALSDFGERIGREYQEGSEALALENRVISDALREEELTLSEERPTMAPDLFRAEAEAFDDKAQAIRRAQDA